MIKIVLTISVIRELEWLSREDTRDEKASKIVGQPIDTPGLHVLVI